MMERETDNRKPILYFVPHYIGSVKYFEKLAPFLEETYEVRFLLLFIHARFFDEMKQYLEKSGKSLIALAGPADFRPESLHIFSFIRGLRAYKKVVAEVLGESRIKKILGVNDSGVYSRYLFAEAEKHGVETLVLQWAMAFEGARHREKKKTRPSRRLLYRFLKPIIVVFKNVAMKMILGSGTDFHKQIMGLGNSKRMGVINNEARDYYIRHGVNPEKISVVGYLDFHFGEKVKRDFDRDEEARRAALFRLGLDTTKKQIVFFSSPYNGKDLKVVDDKGQYEYTESIVKAIRAQCPHTDYDILFKIHPSENLKLYRPLENYGVKIFDKHTNNYELVYFADLYIAGGTATNFVPLVMGKQTLFVNLLKIPVVESTKALFHINSFVHDAADLHERLKAYREGRLEKQYLDSGMLITSDSLKKIVDWISR